MLNSAGGGPSSLRIVERLVMELCRGVRCFINADKISMNKRPRQVSIVTTVVVAALLLCSGCATSTKPGAIGVDRSQLLIVSSDVINKQAASLYATTSNKAQSAGKLNSDTALTARVRGISDKLIKQVGVYRPEAASWKWEVNVFESDQINAFCYPGGKIGVYSGIITRLNLTDSELAAVLGHEISHALREHSREKASQSQLSSAIAQGLASSGSTYGALYGAAASIGSQLFFQLPYSREMESEADVMGLELMARAGYDPRAASNVWRKMQATVGGSKVDFLSTHPASQTRIATLDAAVPKVLPLYKATEAAASPPTAATAPAVVATTANPPPGSPTSAAASTPGCVVKDPKLQGTYEGPCVNGLAEGVGRASGEYTYEGAFSAGIPNGLGVYSRPDGGRFEGLFLNGKPNGKGKVYFPDGGTLAGHFENGSLRGTGTQTSSQGRQRRVELQNGKLVESNEPGSWCLRNEGKLLRCGYGTYELCAASKASPSYSCVLE